MNDPYSVDPLQRPWPSEPPPSDPPAQQHSGVLPAPAAQPLARREGDLTERDRQMMEMAYATGRAQAMAEAAMQAAHAANAQRYYGPPVQTNVYLQGQAQQRNEWGCGAVVIILSLIAVGGLGFLFLPLNPIIGGVILGGALLGLTGYLVILLK